MVRPPFLLERFFPQLVQVLVNHEVDHGREEGSGEGGRHPPVQRVVRLVFQNVFQLRKELGLGVAVRLHSRCDRVDWVQ